jgi:CHASE3 domain sensor protein
MSMSTSIRWLIAVCLGVPLLLIGVSAWVSYDALVATRSSAQWVVHTYDVREKLQDLLVDLQAVETGGRGFLLTHQNSFLEPYSAAMPRIPRQLAELQALVAAKPIQRDNMVRLQALVGDKLAHTRESVALEETGRHEEALALVNSGYGKARMDAIRRVVAELNQVEDRLLAEREAAFSRQLTRNNAITAGIVAVQLLLTAGGGVLLWRFARLHSFVTVCAWSKTIQHEGEWVTFEEYLARRFGVRVTHGINPTEAQRMMDRLNAQATAAGPRRAPGAGQTFSSSL